MLINKIESAQNLNQLKSVQFLWLDITASILMLLSSHWNSLVALWYSSHPTNRNVKHILYRWKLDSVNIVRWAIINDPFRGTIDMKKLQDYTS